MDDDTVIAQITWTVKDVRDKFEETFGREPTDTELRDCVNAVDTSSLEEVSIERGWQFIEAAVGE